MRILDIGCGPGFVSEKIAQLVPNGSVVGLELDDKLFAIATGIALQCPAFAVEKGSVYAMPFPDASFDFAYARFVFQHLDRPVDALREVARVLKPGGTALLLDVDDGWLMLHPEPPGFADLIKRSEAAQAAYGGDRFVGRKLPDYFREAGFESASFAVEVTTSDELSMPVFLEIISGFKLTLLLQQGESRDKIEAELKRIAAHVDLHNGRGAIGVFLVSGRRGGGG
jgi:SAM-dependent methyltransferase